MLYSAVVPENRCKNLNQESTWKGFQLSPMCPVLAPANDGSGFPSQLQE